MGRNDHRVSQQFFWIYGGRLKPFYLFFVQDIQFDPKKLVQPFRAAEPLHQQIVLIKRSRELKEPFILCRENSHNISADLAFRRKT